MKNKVVFFLASIALLSLFMGCEQVPNLLPANGNEAVKADTGTAAAIIIKDSGVVKYINLEGGFYGLVGRMGNYDPVNLPKEFQKDGLRVQFSGEILDIASIHMWGKIIRLISIKTTNSSVKPLIMDTGVLHRKTIQGGPWVAEASTGTYQILNLPNAYMIENLKVVFCGYIRTDIIIVPALWPLVQLYWIEKTPDNPIIVNLKEEFKLPVGTNVAIPSEGIVFSFKSVISDSRCPSDVICVWQGEATILVNVVIGGINYGDYKMSTLRLPAVITAGKYNFQLNNLVPYPVSTSPIDPKAYVGYFIIYPAVSVDTL